MKINKKSWFFKISILSVIIFIISAIMNYLITYQFDYLSGNPIIYFTSVVILPPFLITLYFNREINRMYSILFGGSIGLISGQIVIIYGFISSSINDTSYKDYSLLPMIWLLFSSLFISSGIGGAFVSYFFRKK